MMDARFVGDGGDSWWRMLPAMAKPDDDESRLAKLRSDAEHRYAALDTQGPDPGDDPLGALAWLAGISGPTPDELHRRIEAARAERWPWRSIALALTGDGSDREGRRIREAHERRRAGQAD